MVVVFALLSALSFGTADFLGGLSSRKNSASVAVAWSQLAGLVFIIVAAFVFRAESVGIDDLLWGVIAGLSGSFGILALFRGLSVGLASIVAPMAALLGAALPVIYGLLNGEMPPLVTWIGIVLVLPAIGLLSWEKAGRRHHVMASLRLGTLAGILFGAFFILISQSSDGSGMWPLVAARAATVPVFFSLSLIRRVPISLKPGTRRATVLSGVLDMAANVFYLLAFRTGYLIVAVILTSLAPAPTVLLQKLVYREELTAARLIGLLSSIAGAVLIGIGG